MLVTKNDVAETSHDFYDKPETDTLVAIGIAAVARDDFDYALPAWLLDAFDASAFKVFAQEHDKRRWFAGDFRRFERGDMGACELRVSGKVEPAIVSTLPTLPVFALRTRRVTLQGKGVFGRLNNSIYACIMSGGCAIRRQRLQG